MSLGRGISNAQQNRNPGRRCRENRSPSRTRRRITDLGVKTRSQKRRDLKQSFFDWFNTTGALLIRPVRRTRSQALKELGFDVSPKSISYGLYLGDKHMYERERAPSIRDGSLEEQTKLYAGFHRIILKETGIMRPTAR